MSKKQEITYSQEEVAKLTTKAYMMTDISKQIDEIVAKYMLLMVGMVNGISVEEELPPLKQAILALIDQAVANARRSERKKMTLQKIDKKLLKSEAQKIEFEVQMTGNCRKKHYCAYSSDGKSFSVAMDGQNIISKRGATR